MARKTIDLSPEMVVKVNEYAREHEVYHGNFSAVVREALVSFFGQDHKQTSETIVL